jgi:hypothetical protein
MQVELWYFAAKSPDIFFGKAHFAAQSMPD